MRASFLQSTALFASLFVPSIPSAAAENRFGSFLSVFQLSSYQIPFFQSTFAEAQPATEPALPKNFGYILFPGFQAIDVFGPIDALNILSWNRNITLSLLAKTLDPVPTQVRDPKYNRANSSFSQSIVPTHTFVDAPSLDVLLVPGGIGTRAPDLEDEIDFIRTTYPSLQYLITVCTGAGLAARAGVLDGKNATTNKRAWAETIALGPHVRWVTHARWVVDGNIWTSSGVSAGIDAVFGWMAAVFGESTAAGVANGMEYERHLNASWDPFADLNNLTAISLF